jgi:hypothetical protein
MSNSIFLLMLSICKTYRYEKCKEQTIKLLESNKEIKYPIETINYKSRGDIPDICSLYDFDNIIKSMDVTVEDWNKNIYENQPPIKIGIKIIK